MSKAVTRTAKERAPARRTLVLMHRKGRSKAFAGLNATVVDNVVALRQELVQTSKDTLWISYDAGLTHELLKNISRPNMSLGKAVFLHYLTPKALAALGGYFEQFAFAEDGMFLRSEELTEVFMSTNPGDLFIGGFVNPGTRTITLWRGHLKALTVPYSAFPKSGDGIKPDFNKFAITDSGQSIKLGMYEAATDAILYEFDREYRRRIKKQRQASEQSFGASLRRLRKQRGLTHDDFAPAVASKTVARIEQGQVRKIHQTTLKALATRLGVSPDEIGSF